MTGYRLVYWVVGVLIAFTGVAIVRILPLQVPQERIIFALLAGYTLAILGLFIITLGTRRDGSK